MESSGGLWSPQVLCGVLRWSGSPQVVWEGIPQARSSCTESPIPHCAELGPWGAKPMVGGGAEVACGGLRCEKFLQV